MWAMRLQSFSKYTAVTCSILQHQNKSQHINTIVSKTLSTYSGDFNGILEDVFVLRYRKTEVFGHENACDGSYSQLNSFHSMV